MEILGGAAARAAEAAAEGSAVMVSCVVPYKATRMYEYV